jgi:DNA-binding response OmpR family regulator
MKLLIIEDSDRLRKSLYTGFTELGFAVDCTGDGQEGLNFALSYSYDSIILDIMLPSLDGISILKQVRNRRIDTNILILSAKEQYEDRIRALNLGADDYLCKPFSFDELHARILTLIRRSHQLRSNSIEIGNVTLNIQLKEICVNGDELKLTPLEYSLIEQLALNLDRVLSPEQLLGHLSDSSIVTTKNAVEVHISAARKKLRVAGAPDLIQTKRSFGYVIRKSCLASL